MPRQPLKYIWEAIKWTSFWLFGLFIAIFLFAWGMGFSGCAQASEPIVGQIKPIGCEDHGLQPHLRKACYEMKKICAEVGCSVSVR